MVRGTSDWKPYSIVLNVPAEAQILAFGALLIGRVRSGSMMPAPKSWAMTYP
jgi:hypothetical protein